MLLSDRLIISDKRPTSDGYVVARARAARTGIQLYTGTEVERPDLAVARVYRPPEEVFREDSLGSYAYKPLTNDHPTEMVTSQNWRDVAVGSVGPRVVRDGEFVDLALVLMDQKAIDDEASGKRELSAGYHCAIDWTPGVTPSGEAYDGVQRNIKVNHVALVDAGRAGSDCRIGDQQTKPQPEPEALLMTTVPATQTVVLDGVTVEVSPLVAQLVAKVTKQLEALDAATKASSDAVKAAEASKAEAIATKDGEIAALKAQSVADLAQKDGEIAALTAQVNDTAGLERKALERQQLVTQVKAIDASIDVTGKNDAELRRHAVSKVLGDAAKDMDDNHIIGAWKAITARLSPGVDAVRDSFMAPAPAFAAGGFTGTMTDADKAHAEMTARYAKAHLPKAEGGLN